MVIKTKKRVIEEKKEMKNFIGRLYRVFENHPEKFRFKKLRGDNGYIMHEPHGTGKSNSKLYNISLDHRRDLFPTLIHECLHYFHPCASETWILKHESEIVNRLSEQQVKAILKRFVTRVC